jgi:Domain of unknown function (DUF6249)
MNDSVLLLPILGMLVTFVLPVFLVATILYYKHRRQRMTHDTIVKLAEKGLPIPPELLEPPAGGKHAQSSGLRAGLVLVGLGIALGIFLWEIHGPWSIGLIPGLMGAALLIAWKIEERAKG